GAVERLSRAAIGAVYRGAAADRKEDLRQVAAAPCSAVRPSWARASERGTQMGTTLGAKSAEWMMPATAVEAAEEVATRLEVMGWPDRFPLLALPWELGRAAVVEVLDLRAKSAARAADYPGWSRAAAWAFRVAGM